MIPDQAEFCQSLETTGRGFNCNKVFDPIGTVIILAMADFKARRARKTRAQRAIFSHWVEVFIRLKLLLDNFSLWPAREIGGMGKLAYVAATDPFRGLDVCRHSA